MKIEKALEKVKALTCKFDACVLIYNVNDALWDNNVKGFGENHKDSVDELLCALSDCCELLTTVIPTSSLFSKPE